MQFFFHIRADGQLIPDEEGMALRDIAAARVELKASADDLARSFFRAGGIAKHVSIEIEDEDGNILDSVAVRPTLH